jgi:hypothetical protein
MNKMRKRLIVAETAVAGLVGLLALSTIFWRDWLEVLFGWDPDHHSGTAELALIAALAVTSLLLGCIARWQVVRWRRASAALIH